MVSMLLLSYSHIHSLTLTLFVSRLPAEHSLTFKMAATILNSLPSVFTQLHEAKNASGKTFEQISKEIGKAEWYTAAMCVDLHAHLTLPLLRVLTSNFNLSLTRSFYGQAKPEPKDLEAISKSLGLEMQILEKGLGPNFWPDRGLGPTPPTGTFHGA